MRSARSIRGKYVQATFGLEPDTFEQLESYAHDHELTVSQAGRLAIRLFLSQNIVQIDTDCDDNGKAA